MKSFVKHTIFGPPGNVLRPVNHGLLKGLKFHIDTQSRSLHLMGMYEREIASDLRSLAARATTALDIGANDGWYAQYFVSVPNIQKVFAFEPDPGCRAAIQSNLDANDPSFNAKMTMVPKMVGNKNDEQWVSVDSLAGQMTGTILLKIDVDGGEVEVLHGATQTLTQSKCVLVIETHSAELEKNCIAFLQGLGYKCRIITSAWYRALLPEGRPSVFNQWFVAERI